MNSERFHTENSSEAIHKEARKAGRGEERNEESPRLGRIRALQSLLLHFPALA
jgi:hypothetical protein